MSSPHTNVLVLVGLCVSDGIPLCLLLSTLTKLITTNNNIKTYNYLGKTFVPIPPDIFEIPIWFSTYCLAGLGVTWNAEAESKAGKTAFPTFYVSCVLETVHWAGEGRNLPASRW